MTILFHKSNKIGLGTRVKKRASRNEMERQRMKKTEEEGNWRKKREQMTVELVNCTNNNNNDDNGIIVVGKIELNDQTCNH